MRAVADMGPYRWPGVRCGLVDGGLATQPGQRSLKLVEQAVVAIGNGDDRLKRGTWRLLDQFSGETYQRDDDEMLDPGLYVDLIPWGWHFFRFDNL